MASTVPFIAQAGYSVAASPQTHPPRQYALELLPAYFEHRVPPLDAEPRARLKKSLTDGVEKYRAAVEKGR